MQKSTLFFYFILASFAALAQDGNKLPVLHFLEGTWKMGNGSKSFFEHWARRGPDELSGMSYRIKGNDTIVFERVRIAGSGSEINYLATVKNQNEGKEVPFRLISEKDQTFIFENLAHDFPQRVIYQFVFKDSLHAWIEGVQNGKPGREDYYYSRVK